jgi:hypothetical protein
MNHSSEILSEEFVPPCEVKAGMLLIPLEEAERFVERCKELRFAIIGVEGFIDHGEKVESQIDLIVDFSKHGNIPWMDFVLKCSDEAKGFLAEVPHRENLVLHFSPLSEHEWNSLKSVDHPEPSLFSVLFYRVVDFFMSRKR